MLVTASVTGSEVDLKVGNVVARDMFADGFKLNFGGKETFMGLKRGMG